MSRLGELLVREKLISLSQLQQAQDEQRKNRCTPRLQPRQARHRRRAGAHQLPLEAVPRPVDQPRRVRDRRRGPEARPERDLREAPGHPGHRAGATLIVAMADPSNIYAIDDLKFLTGYNIEPSSRPRPRSTTAIERYYEKPVPPTTRCSASSTTTTIEFARRRRRRQRPRPREGSGRRAGRQAVQHDPAQRHQEGRERHPHRAVREEAPRPLPHRRRALRRDAAAAQAARTRSRQPPQDHGVARHRRAPPAAGRPHQAQARQGQGDGLPRLRPADAVRREDRHASPRQGRTCSST